MARKKSSTLTDSEHRIMEALWGKGSATVAEVADSLKGKEGSAYTTVLTMMRILREKGYLKSRKEGRADVYSPTVSRTAAARTATRHLLSKFFSDSPGELVLSFLKDEELKPEEIAELKRQISQSNKTKAKK